MACVRRQLSMIVRACANPTDRIARSDLEQFRQSIES